MESNKTFFKNSKDHSTNTISNKIQISCSKSIHLNISGNFLICEMRQMNKLTCKVCPPHCKTGQFSWTGIVRNQHGKKTSWYAGSVQLPACQFSSFLFKLSNTAPIWCLISFYLDTITIKQLYDDLTFFFSG